MDPPSSGIAVRMRAGTALPLTDLTWRTDAASALGQEPRFQQLLAYSHRVCKRRLENQNFCGRRWQWT